MIEQVHIGFDKSPPTMPSKGSIPEPEPEPSYEPEVNQPEVDVTSQNESETSLK